MRKNIVLHPFLFALYVLLSLLAYNIAEMNINEIFLPAIIVLGSTLIFYLLFLIILKNKSKSGIITSLFLFMFFSYGRIWDYLYDFFTYRHWKEEIFFISWFFIFFIATFFIIKTKKQLVKLSQYLNIVSIILIVFPVITIVTKSLQVNSDVSQFEDKKFNSSGHLPDIYYIILDGYARADVLKEFYNYDNSDFLNYLRKKGFYIATQSKANYAQTALSLSCSLNFTYLDELAEKMGKDSYNRKPLREMIADNRVVRLLKKVGYKFVCFSSGIAITKMRNADITMDSSVSFFEFENLLVNITPVPFLWERLLRKSPYDLHRERILYIFDNIPNIPKIDAPKFVFVHIIAPHPPFIFGKNGEKLNSKRKFSFADGGFVMKKEEYIKGYRDQLIFVTKKTKEMVTRLLADNKEKPVIILQADHGPGSILNWRRFDKKILHERMSIFNAYYFPHKKGYKYLYPQISPVNTFRLLFNIYFNAGYNLLEDKHYFSAWHTPYRFHKIQ